MENTEINTNAVEETVTENIVENAVAADPGFAEKHPILYTAGVCTLVGACVATGGCIVAGIVNGASKLYDKFCNKIAERKAEKAKKIEAVTVEKND